ncbi:hypothetical protein GCM10009623_32750 [Nocardioides aestuarii]
MVWVRVAGWMIADGEVPVPSRGDVLSDLGVRFRGEVAAAASEASDGIEEFRQDSAPSEVIYRATGRASEARDFYFEIDPGVRDHATDFVLAVGPVRYQVQSTGWAADVPEGARLTVTGQASVIGSYEWDDFGLADVRGDWQVTGVASSGEEDILLDLQPTVHDGP